MTNNITHTVNATLDDGTIQTHTAEALEVRHFADGCIGVMSSCCGKVGGTAVCSSCQGNGYTSCHNSGSVKLEDTRSWHTFYDVASLSNEQMLSEVKFHVQRVAENHLARSKAMAFIVGLIKPSDSSPTVVPLTNSFNATTTVQPKPVSVQPNSGKIPN